jgi:hypothetical protein
MAADQLQQLRDIHLPDPPGWWPPAPGWWLVALLLMAALVWLIRRARSAQRRRRPLRRARRLYAGVYQRYQRGELSGREYLDQSNEVIKRALIHGLGEREARRASGEAWLALLDRHLDEPVFTRGPGRLLGNARFQPHIDSDAAAVHPLLEKLLERLLARLAPHTRGSSP